MYDVKKIIQQMAQQNGLFKIQESIFKKGITKDYISNIYDEIQQYLTDNEKQAIEKFIEYEDSEKDELEIKKYKTGGKSFVENPEIKCDQFLSFLDCTCELPLYLVSFLEIVGQKLEEKAQPLNDNVQTLYKNNPEKIPKDILDKLYFRELPVSQTNISQTIIKKKRQTSVGEYTQQIQSHMGKIYRLKDIKEFKIFCKKVKDEMMASNTPHYASYGDQDFKYLPSMYKQLYNIDTPTFSKRDKKLIIQKYLDFYKNFQEYKQTNNIKNISKMFVIIQYLIQGDKYLKDKYSGLFQYIVQQNLSTQQKNVNIFEECKQ